MTIPTIITPEQYSNALLAVNRENGDHWLFWATDGSTVYDRHLFLCRDEQALNRNYEDLDWAEVQSVDITDENGCLEEVEAWTFKAKQVLVSNLDLDALSKGEVVWY